MSNNNDNGDILIIIIIGFIFLIFVTPMFLDFIPPKDRTTVALAIIDCIKYIFTSWKFFLTIALCLGIRIIYINKNTIINMIRKKK